MKNGHDAIKIEHRILRLDTERPHNKRNNVNFNIVKSTSQVELKINKTLEMFKKAKRLDDDIINKQCKIIEHYFDDLERMQSCDEEEDEDDSEDDDGSCYLDNCSDSEGSMCAEDCHNQF